MHSPAVKVAESIQLRNPSPSLQDSLQITWLHLLPRSSRRPAERCVSTASLSCSQSSRRLFFSLINKLINIFVKHHGCMIASNIAINNTPRSERKLLERRAQCLDELIRGLWQPQTSYPVSLFPQSFWFGDCSGDFKTFSPDKTQEIGF